MPDESPDTKSPLSERLRVSTPTSPVFEPPDARQVRADAILGKSFGGWRFTRLLGIGPTSAAFEVTTGSDARGSRGVARVLVGPAGQHEAMRHHFLRGAYAANRFRHPRVVQVVADGETDEEETFVVRAWQTARTLDEIVESDGPMPIESALRIGEQLLDALEIAHSQGVVHGAVTPTNVLVTARGSIRLTDFSTPPGAGKAVPPWAEAPLAARRGPFAPPEWWARPPTAASEETDVFGVGACMYYALTGKPPRKESAAIEDLGHLDPVPMRELRPEVSEDLAKVVHHALHRTPEERYDGAYAMLGDVRRVMAGRAPKLSDAFRPIPSSSFRQVRFGAPPSTNQLPSSTTRSVGSMPAPDPKSGSSREWRGNLMLIVAIASLVGLATYVMARERMQETDAPPAAPSASAPVGEP